MANKSVSELDEFTGSDLTSQDYFLLSDENSGSYASNKISYTKLKEILNFPTAEDLIAQLLDLIYPLGAIYISAASSIPTILPGTWKKISEGYYLQQAKTDSELGTTVGEQLPNITGSIINNSSDNELLTYADGISSSGALFIGNGTGINSGLQSSAYGGGYGYNGIKFDASKSNSIYMNNGKVRPNSIRVNIWRRMS